MNEKIINKNDGMTRIGWWIFIIGLILAFIAPLFIFHPFINIPIMSISLILVIIGAIYESIKRKDASKMKTMRLTKKGFAKITYINIEYDNGHYACFYNENEIGYPKDKKL